MKTFALFADGSSHEILLDFLIPREGEPLKPIPINITDKDVIYSAQNGFWSTYHVLTGQGYIKEDLCFSYQFAGELAVSVLGPSAGLGFSLKLAQEVYCRATGLHLDSAMAATGVVSDGTDRAKVTGVTGIVPKLHAALAALGRGDKIFLPAENVVEIPAEILDESNTRGIELIPVATVGQAIKRLLERFPEEVYPIEIEGLELSPTDPETYLLTRQLHSGSRTNIPLRITNKGGLPISAELRLPDRVEGWLKVVPSTISLPPGECGVTTIEIPAGNPWLFSIKHILKPIFRQEDVFTLSLRILGQRPYDFAKIIRANVKFVNYVPLSAVVLVIVLGLAGYLGFHVKDTVKVSSAEKTQAMTVTPEMSLTTAPQPALSQSASSRPPPSRPPSPANQSEPALSKPPPGPLPAAQEPLQGANELTLIILGDLEQGRFAEARAKLNELQHLDPNHEQASRLAGLMKKPLTVSSELTPYPDGKPFRGEMVSIPSKGGFQIRFTPDDICYVYIYQIDSHKKMNRLFPSEESSHQHHQLPGGITSQLPQLNDWFVVDNNTGLETVYLVASRWPATDLEEIYDRYNETSDMSEKNTYVNQMIARLSAWREACVGATTGCFYKEHPFWHR